MLTSRGEQRREGLLQAALERFAADGFDGVTTRAIAEQTGVSEAALFKYFPTKRALFLAVVRDLAPDRLIDPHDTLPAEVSAEEALAAAVRSHLDLAWEHRTWLMLVLAERERDAEVREALRAQFTSVRQALRSLLQALAERGDVRAGMVGPATQIIMMSLRGFLVWALRQNPPRSWPATRDWFVQALVDLLLHGIASEQGQP
ncbi:MAG: TetR/AcrR family transcriptional regulator [Armatimonadota bacterium]